MKEDIEKLLAEYKEAQRTMELGMAWLKEKDYAEGKLEIVKMIIADLEKLAVVKQ